MRRKAAPVVKTAQVDEKKLQEVARKAGLSELPVMDEVNIIMEDDSVLQFKMAKVFATLAHDRQGKSTLIAGNPTNTIKSKLSADMRGEVLPGLAGLAGLGGGAPQVAPADEADVQAPQVSFEAAAEDQD